MRCHVGEGQESLDDVSNAMLGGDRMTYAVGGPCHTIKGLMSRMELDSSAGGRMGIEGDPPTQPLWPRWQEAVKEGEPTVRERSAVCPPRRSHNNTTPTTQPASKSRIPTSGKTNEVRDKMTARRVWAVLAMLVGALSGAFALGYWTHRMEELPDTTRLQMRVIDLESENAELVKAAGGSEAKSLFFARYLLWVSPDSGGDIAPSGDGRDRYDSLMLALAKLIRDGFALTREFASGGIEVVLLPEGDAWFIPAPASLALPSSPEY